MRVSLIVPAAGLSSRFYKSLAGSAKASVIPFQSKLFCLLKGEPVLLRTLKAFHKIPQIREIIIAISPEMRPEVAQWMHSLKGLEIKLISGGKTRAESVWNALKVTSPLSDWIMVHDGARPMVSERAIKEVLKAGQGWDGVILAKKVVPTLKRVLTEDGRIQETVDRGALFEAETPQLVRR